MTPIRTTLVLAGAVLLAVLLAAGTAQAQQASQVVTLSGSTAVTGQWQCCRAGPACAATTITANAVAAGTSSSTLSSAINTLFNGNAAFPRPRFQVTQDAFKYLNEVWVHLISHYLNPLRFVCPSNPLLNGSAKQNSRSSRGIEDTDLLAVSFDKTSHEIRDGHWC